MRTKLLLAAATLAAGLASSMAQSNVYSVNVVGYYNVTVPGGHTGNNYTPQVLFANQLTNSGDISIDLTNGPVSDPTGTYNTLLSFYDGVHFTTYAYFTADDASANGNSGSGTGWYLAADTSGPYHINLAQGNSAYIQNPGNAGHIAAPVTITVVGQVVQGQNTVPILVGNHTYSLIPPVSTNVDSFPSYPGISDPSGTYNDVLSLFNPTTQSFQAGLQWFTGTDAVANGNNGSQTGWYNSANLNYESSDSAFMPAVGQGFFIQRFPNLGSSSNWVYSFTVQ